jgi:hypothetical protein
MNADRMAFRRESIVLEDGSPFGTKMEPWQAEDFAAVDAGRHTYRERPRGHSKTFDLAVDMVTEMVLGKPRQKIYALAADEEQAKLLESDIAGIFTRNPALRPLARVKYNEIIMRETGTVFRVLNSNAPTLYGLRPDLVCVDELTEHRSRDAFDAIWTATGKRPAARVHSISSAGWDRTHFAWSIREHARTDPAWTFLPRGQCASWISPAWLDQQRRTLPAHVFKRLHEGVWADAGGAWLSSEQVDGVFAGPIPEDDAGPRSLGLDIGIARDRTAVAVVQRRSGVVVVEVLDTFAPTRANRVDLTMVEEDVTAMAFRYRCPLVIDPFQAIGLSQRLTHRGLQVTEYPFTSDGRRRLFGGLLDLISTGCLRAQPHEALRRELLGLEVKEGLAGWRVDHRSNAFDDCVVAVALAVAGLPAEPVVGNIMPWAGPSAAERVAAWSRAHGQSEPAIQTWDERSATFWDNLTNRGRRGSW